MTDTLRHEVLAELEKLPEATLQALLDSLRQRPEDGLRNWSWAIGSMTDDEVNEMMQIIEEGCEQVDADGW